MAISTDAVIDLLRPVHDPELHRSIVDLGMVRDVVVSSGGQVSLTVVLTVAGCPLRNEIQSRVDSALTAHPEVSSVALNFGVMNDAERENVRRIVHGDAASTAGSGQAHGHAEGRAPEQADPFHEQRQRGQAQAAPVGSAVQETRGPVGPVGG